jgi:hypothetical protein
MGANPSLIRHFLLVCENLASVIDVAPASVPEHSQISQTLASNYHGSWSASAPMYKQKGASKLHKR